MSSDRGRLVVISGPTASGKSTLWKRLVTHPGLDFSVSATTRPRREGEVVGKDYYFLGAEEFSQLVQDGAFLEYATVHGQSYGTLRAEVEKSLHAGRDILLEIDVRGAEQLADCGLPMISIFVQPPSLEVLRQRLFVRGTEDEKERERRLAIVVEEMKSAPFYDFVVVNDDLARMVQEVENILGLEVSA